jgi:hypothetical protein
VSDAVAHAAAELEAARKERPDDADAIAAALGLYARTLIAAGQREEAHRVADELVEVLTSGRLTLGSLGGEWLLIAPALEGLGRESDLLAGTEHASPGGFTDFARRYGDGDLVGAAEISARLGERAEEAYARLRAAEKLVAAGRRADAEEQLAQAIAFWRSVGATYYVRRGEALLAASA